MLTDYFSYCKVTNRLIPFHEKKNSPKLKDCQNCNVIESLVYLYIDVYLINRKQELLLMKRQIRLITLIVAFYIFLITLMPWVLVCCRPSFADMF